MPDTVRVPEELLRWLENQFPDRAPNMEDSSDMIRFKSGQVSVVRSLKALAKRTGDGTNGRE